jgi:hypothetical protein
MRQKAQKSTGKASFSGALSVPFVYGVCDTIDF